MAVGALLSMRGRHRTYTRAGFQGLVSREESLLLMQKTVSTKSVISASQMEAILGALPREGPRQPVVLLDTAQEQSQVMS